MTFKEFLKNTHLKKSTQLTYMSQAKKPRNKKTEAAHIWYTMYLRERELLDQMAMEEVYTTHCAPPLVVAAAFNATERLQADHKAEKSIDPLAAVHIPVPNAHRNIVKPQKSKANLDRLGGVLHSLAHSQKKSDRMLFAFLEQLFTTIDSDKDVKKVITLYLDALYYAGEE